MDYQQGQQAAYIGQAEKACKVNEIPEMMAQLSERLKHVQAAADQLENRLTSVLRPNPPSAITANTTVPFGGDIPKATAHGNELMSLHQRLGVAKNLLEDMLNRLEV